MTTVKVAVTLPEGALKKAKKAVKAGQARSLSAFVGQALEEKIQRDELVDILDAMDAEFGKPSKADETWAKTALTR